MKIVILGGYGTFGGRLAELLADEPRVHLVIAGRSKQKADAMLAGLSGAAAKTAVALDRDGDLGARLVELRPDLVVDASGPFQDYGDDRYRVVEACLANRIPYLDLADGADFVVGITGSTRRRRRGASSSLAASAASRC